MLPNHTTWQLLKDLASYIKPYKKPFFLGIFFRITSDLLWLYPAWAISEIITFVSQYQLGENAAYFWQLTLWVWIIAIYYCFAHDFCKYLIYPIAERISLDAQLKTLKHLFSLDLTWHEKELSGNKIKRITKGGESLNKILRLMIDLFIESTISLLGVIVVLATINWQLILFLIAFFISYYFLSLHLTKKASTQEYKANVEWERFEGVSYEAVNNINTIKSLGIATNIYNSLSKSADRLMQYIRERIFRFRLRAGILNSYKEFIRQALILYTVLQVLQGHLEVGIIALVFFYFRRIEESARELADVQNEFIIAKIALGRLHEILEEKPILENSGRKNFNKSWKQLEFKNVTFSYHQRKVLENFNLTVKRGEKIGIVGLSGGGKSTLFKLLLKLYETKEGDIYYDHLNLHDIKRSSYLQHIAIVPQETELFNLSLRENITITRGKEKENTLLLEKVLEIAHVKDFLFKLPHGIESLVGEKGVRLSGGEKQRVGIARALYKQPQILLLDEATSHLDLISEKKIQDALEHFLKDITAIVIAHRLSTIQKMDKIVFIKNGHISEQGTFKKLLEKKGEFWQLYQKQKF